MRSRILFVTPVLHHPPKSGPTLRIENSIKALSQIADLTIYCRIAPTAIGGKEGVAFYAQYCKGFYWAPFTRKSPNVLRLVKRAINLLTGYTFRRRIFSFGSHSAEDAWHLLWIAQRVRADVIWLGYGNISYPLLESIKRNSRYPVVVDTDSVWSRFVLRGLSYVHNDAERQQIEQDGRAKQEEERWGTQLADVTTAVSEVDANYYRALTSKPKSVHLFSNVIDIDMYSHLPPPPTGFVKPCIFVAGTFWPNSPMEDAARWVITDVLPRLQQKLPGLHFYIVGDGSDTVLSDVGNEHITVTGRLPSILPYLRHADVALVPLRFESGTRFKILEAGACGVPVVSTTLGAEGLSVSHQEHILIADHPDEFGEAILQVIIDQRLAQLLAGNLRQLVIERYGLASLEREGQAVLGYLGLL